MTKAVLQTYKKHFWIPGIIVAALTGAVFFVLLFGPAVYNVEGLTFRAALQPARNGETILQIPPLGSISADTHNLPVAIQITLNNIETDLASSFFQDNDEKTIWHEADFKILVRPFLLRQICVAITGAATAVLLLWRFKPKLILYGALTGLLASGTFLYSLSASYDLDAFAQPEVNGVLSLAASIFPEPDTLLQKLDEVQSQTKLMVNSIEALFASTNGLAAIASPENQSTTKKILLVGDLHSNPIGVNLIRNITDAFVIDMIIDTGDLTDFGSSFEATFLQELNKIAVPYLFCPGNHDSPEIIETIQEMPTGKILVGDMIEIAGIKILGSPDPLYTSDSVIEDDKQKELLSQQLQIEKIKSQAELQPDIIVVHNSDVATALGNSFPLIITGHTHRQNITDKGDSLIINPGTTGAAGIRGLYSHEATPYSAAILYIKPGEKAIALDMIKYIPANHNFVIERKLLTAEDEPHNQPSAQTLVPVKESND